MSGRHVSWWSALGPAPGKSHSYHETPDGRESAGRRCWHPTNRPRAAHRRWKVHEPPPQKRRSDEWRKTHRMKSEKDERRWEDEERTGRRERNRVESPRKSSNEEGPQSCHWAARRRRKASDENGRPNVSLSIRFAKLGREKANAVRRDDHECRVTAERRPLRRTPR